jgi:hypothetical protein
MLGYQVLPFLHLTARERVRQSSYTGPVGHYEMLELFLIEMKQVYSPRVSGLALWVLPIVTTSASRFDQVGNGQ